MSFLLSILLNESFHPDDLCYASNPIYLKTHFTRMRPLTRMNYFISTVQQAFIYYIILTRSTGYELKQILLNDTRPILVWLFFDFFSIAVFSLSASLGLLMLGFKGFGVAIFLKTAFSLVIPQMEIALTYIHQFRHFWSPNGVVIDLSIQILDRLPKIGRFRHKRFSFGVFFPNWDPLMFKWIVQSPLVYSITYHGTLPYLQIKEGWEN